MKPKKKNKIIKNKIPLAKSLGALMKDEDGFVSKEAILRVGLSTVAALGMTGALTDFASADTVTHQNVILPDTTTDCGHCAQHTNVTTHSSY